MKIECTAKVLVGRMAGLAAGVVYLVIGVTDAPAAQGPGGRTGTPLSERIDVEQAVDFPNDI